MLEERVAIARALMNRPALILADEPTGNLDTESSQQTLSLMREINKAEGTAMFISTHDEGVAAFCDRRLYLRDGVIERED